MRCGIEDKATPKTGGVTNRAYPTVASRFEPGISKSGFPPICRGELCKTNPIYPGHTPKTQNEPNSHIPSVPPPPISAKRTQFAPTLTIPHTKKSKRTQFHQANSQSPKAKSCFSRNEPNFTRGGPMEDQNMRNKPNSASPTSLATPHFTKRTQFTTQPGNLTYGHDPPVADAPNAQNEPNSARPTANRQPQKAKICETNPIPAQQHPTPLPEGHTNPTKKMRLCARVKPFFAITYKANNAQGIIPFGISPHLSGNSIARSPPFTIRQMQERRAGISRIRGFWIAIGDIFCAPSASPRTGFFAAKICKICGKNLFGCGYAAPGPR